MAYEMEHRNLTRILVVDDVEANRFILRDIINDMGYQPVLTENGMQAMKVLQRIRPQLIILDIAMPEMDGYEVCQKIKEDSEYREIPIIFISAFDDAQDIVKGFSLGGEDYITKPFIPEIVKARIGTHLKLYEANYKMQAMNRQLQVTVSEKQKQMELERKSILYALIRMARENAYYDEAYMDRLQYDCRLLTEAMQLSELYGQVISDQYVDAIELAVALCDLGNIAIHTNILQKQGMLNEEESIIMRRHTTIGARILKDISQIGNDNHFINMAIDIANFHHENWDGSGYPDGKKENEIPLSAQIVAVVSSYVALTEKRTYRQAFSKKEALEILERDMNKKYNPDIVWILKKIARQLK